MDAFYFRVSSERQPTENQFEDLLQVAERDDSGRNWTRIRELLAQSVYEEQLTGRTVYRVRPEIAAELARDCIYVEQGKSGKAGARRPLFQQMKRDAALRRFARLLVWKVSRLGRDFREMLNTVYELADAGVTVVPLKSPTGPINSSLGKLLWAVQAWAAEFENDERAEAAKAGQARARAAGKHVGSRAVFRRDQIAELRSQGRSWRQTADQLGVGVGTVRREYSAAVVDPEALHT